MAVQQNKKSPSKRGMHRSHDFLSAAPLAVEPSTGEVHLRHHVSPNGYYRGKKVVASKSELHPPSPISSSAQPTHKKFSASKDDESASSPP